MNTYTVAQTAKLLSVSEGSVYRYIRKGKLTVADDSSDIKLVTSESIGKFLQGVTTMSDSELKERLNNAKKEFNNLNDLQGVTQVSDNPINDLVIRLDAIIEELKLENRELRVENKALTDRLIASEQKQKEEIINLSRTKDAFAMSFMSNYKLSLENKPQQSHTDAESVEAEIIDDEVRATRKKRKKELKGYGFSKKKIAKILDKEFGL